MKHCVHAMCLVCYMQHVLISLFSVSLHVELQKIFLVQTYYFILYKLQLQMFFIHISHHLKLLMLVCACDEWLKLHRRNVCKLHKPVCKNWEKDSIWSYIEWFAYVCRIHRFPEALPKIDFAFYSSRVSNAALIAEFEKTVYSYLSLYYSYCGVCWSHIRSRMMFIFSQMCLRTSKCCQQHCGYWLPTFSEMNKGRIACACLVNHTQ